MSLVIRKSSILELENSPNMEELMEEYADESSIGDLPPPSAKVEMYKQLENMGALHTIGAFLGDLLIGFITVLSPILPHYGVKVAVSESFFVSKRHRKTGAGLRLLHEAEKYTKETYGYGLLVSAPYGGNLAEVLPHVGYAETNRVFFRKLVNE